MIGNLPESVTTAFAYLRVAGLSFQLASQEGASKMTAYEYMDLAYSAFSAAATIVSLLIAVLSGYLVVAYVIGSNLTRVQVTVLNAAYSIWSIYLMLNGTINLSRARSYLISAAELDQQLSPPVPYIVHGYVSIGLLLWLTSLWFMWSVRHPKSE
jgi:hypothetical protein